MKRFVLLAVSIALVSIFLCPMVIAVPSMPADLQMVQPDPSLPKELAALWGKWDDARGSNWFVIIEKIDEEKASLYLWWSGAWVWEGGIAGWQRIEAKTMKEAGKHKLWFRISGVGPGTVVLTSKGEYLDVSGLSRLQRLRRVP